MTIIPHAIQDLKIAELLSDVILIHNAEDALELMVNLSYQGFDKIILYQKNLSLDFFDLKNKMAGEILQKFSNYRIQLAIVGDYSVFTSKALRDFIYESNKGKLVSFTTSLQEALHRLTQ